MKEIFILIIAIPVLIFFKWDDDVDYSDTWSDFRW